MRFIRIFLTAGLISLVAFGVFSGFKSSPAWGADSRSGSAHVDAGQIGGQHGAHNAGQGSDSGASMRQHMGHRPVSPHGPNRIGGVAVLGGDGGQNTAPSGAGPVPRIQPARGRFFGVVDSPATLYRKQSEYYVKELTRLSKAAQGMKPGSDKAELARQFIQVSAAWRNAERAFQDATLMPAGARSGQQVARTEEDARVQIENQRLLNAAMGYDSYVLDFHY